MTPEDWYRQLDEITEGFQRRQRIHHHFVRIIKEVQAETDEENVKLRTELALCLVKLNAPKTA